MGGKVMSSESSIEVLCQKAREAIAQRDPEKARQLYLEALGLRSDSPDVHYGLATVCFQLKDLHSASHHFKEVTRLDPLRAGAFINLGAIYNLLDQLDEAIPALRRGIQLDSRRAEGYYNLALVHRRKGQLDLAVQAYREALRVNPQMADANYNLANVYVEKEQYGLAINHYKHALKLRPNWDKAQKGLAQAEAALNQARGPTALQTAEASPTAPIPTTNVDLERTIDPVTQGELLTNLHRATIESENFSRQFLKVVEGEIEPALKELSSCLLYPDSTISELDQCVLKFEEAIASMRSAQRSIQLSMERVRSLGDRFFK
jgi:tetratricopeptide (TPR) repeat protein